MDDLDAILKRYTKDELIALIKQMLPKQLGVEWQLTMPSPTGKRKTAINPETYRRQVADAFRHSDNTVCPS